MHNRDDTMLAGQREGDRVVAKVTRTLVHHGFMSGTLLSNIWGQLLQGLASNRIWLKDTASRLNHSDACHSSYQVPTMYSSVTMNV